MYTHPADLDGAVNSTRLEAVNADGVRFKFTTSNSGLRRAEIEGQMSRFRDDPEELKYVAQSYENTNPDKAEVVTVEIIVRYYDLEDGERSGEVTEKVVASWTKEGEGSA
ncbi:hypothetical protein [Haloglycomyces albus]|uniref:hypothetical protein n=1 Tax=Haloglycomyces albus TaxID=526067 RepID=UPI0004B904DD|nr:hypothetical protein [Haloglycomyces albus]